MTSLPKPDDTTIHPELWDDHYTEKEKQLLTAVSQRYGLDPLAREVMMLDGNVYVTAAGIKRLAIQDPDYDGCEIEIIERNWETNQFLVKAKVWKKDCSRPFEDFGDASPENSRMKGGALLRHAITRARARAMRSAFSIPFCSVEELDSEQRMQLFHRRRETTLRPRLSGANTPKEDTRDSELASTQQHNSILRYTAELEMDHLDLVPEIKQRFGIASLDKLTREQARILLESLETRVIERAEAAFTSFTAQGNASAISVPVTTSVPVPSPGPSRTTPPPSQKKSSKKTYSKKTPPPRAQTPPVPSKKTASQRKKIVSIHESDKEAPKFKERAVSQQTSTHTSRTPQGRNEPPRGKKETQAPKEQQAQQKPSEEQVRGERMMRILQRSRNMEELREGWDLFREMQQQFSPEWRERLRVAKDQKKIELTKP